MSSNDLSQDSPTDSSQNVLHMAKQREKGKTKKKVKPEPAVDQPKFPEKTKNDESEDLPFKGLGLPDRDLKKNLGCG
jgi:hypothetical protein